MIVNRGNVLYKCSYLFYLFTLLFAVDDDDDYDDDYYDIGMVLVMMAWC